MMRALQAARRRAEWAAESAQSAMLEAQNANQAKTQFLANMSHELRTPLNAIIGFSEIIRDQLMGPLGKNDNYLTYAHDIHDAATHLLAMINDILDVTKIESGAMELKERRFNLRNCLRSCAKLLAEQAKLSSVNLTIGVADDLPDVKGDENKVRQIVINIMSNAIKFTPENGEVWLNASATKSGATVIEIADTGIGISEDQIDKIFLPFFQVDGSHSRKNGGTGLGLAITKALVQLHGGEISVTSELNRGSRVIVKLPAYRSVWNDGREIDQ